MSEKREVVAGFVGSREGRQWSWHGHATPSGTWGLMQAGAFLMSSLLLSACAGILAPEEILVLEVLEAAVPCVGVGRRDCLLVRSGGGEPELFYDEIQGFTFEEGYRYTLEVSRRTLPDPPADASSYTYHLERQESRIRSPWYSLLQATRAAELRWLSARPDPYHMTLQRGCFCIREAIGPVVMEVDALGDTPWDTVVSAQYTADGAPVPAQYQDLFLPVGELFGAIREAVARGAERVEVDFDHTRGFPSRIYIDQDSRMADEEVEFRVLSVGGG